MDNLSTNNNNYNIINNLNINNNNIKIEQNNFNVNVNNLNSDNKSILSIQSNQKSGITQVTSSSQIVGDLSKIVKFAIIDLREPSEFEKYHIKEALNMPFYNISRDKYPNEVYLIKNQLDKMIIAYSEDERNTIPHCQLLYQKGFDNIYMLTGGIEEFVQNYPEYCEGLEMAEKLIEIRKKEALQKEQMNKPRYKNTKSSIAPSEQQETKNFIQTSNNNKIKSSIKNSNIGVDNSVKSSTTGNNKAISNKISSITNNNNIKEKEKLDSLRKDLGVPNNN